MLLVHGGEGAVVDVVKQQEIVVCNVNNQQFFFNRGAFSPHSRALCTEIPRSPGIEPGVARQGLWLLALTTSSCRSLLTISSYVPASRPLEKDDVILGHSSYVQTIGRDVVKLQVITQSAMCAQYHRSYLLAKYHSFRMI
jgi:hypothetical protein